MIEPENAALWFCGKELIRGKKLMDHVGKNEKTKVVIKITKVGQICHFIYNVYEKCCTLMMIRLP